MKFKILCLFVIVSLTFISCSGKSDKTFTSRKASESLSLSSEEREFQMDVFLLLDQSGSMNGTAVNSATDPDGLRVSASKYLIRNIASKSDEGSPHQIGIVNFGSNAPSKYIVPLTKASKQSDEESNNLISSLGILSLGNTSFISALKGAYNGFLSKDTFSNKRKPVIIIFTDGEPDDDRKLSQDEYFNEIQDFIQNSLQPKGCDIYVIGIDASGSNWSNSAPRWKKVLPEGHVYPISNMDQLKAQFNEVIRQILGIPAVSPDIVTPKGMEFDVPPYLDRIEFHVFPKNQGLTLSIYGPDGKAIDDSSSKVAIKEHEGYSIITVLEPSYGEWKYQIVGGEGKIEVYRNAMPIKMKLISPRESYPLGKPMNIVASFLKPDGKEVEEIAQFPIGLTAKVIAPDGTESNLKLMRDKNGICFGAASIENIKQEGIYRVILIMKGGDVYKSSQENIVLVAPMPYIMIDNPLVDSVLSFRKSLKIRANLLYNGSSVNPEKEFSDVPDTLVLAQIVQSPSEGKSDAIWLNPIKDVSQGGFYGILPANLNQEGRYVLMVKLSGQLRSGENWPNDYTEVMFAVKPNFLQKAGRSLLCGIYLVAGIIVLAFIIWLTWVISLPQMQGVLYIYPSGEGSDTLLSQERLDRKKYKFFRTKKTGKTPPRIIWVNRERGNRASVKVRYWEGLVTKSKRLGQNDSINIGKTHSVKYI